MLTITKRLRFCLFLIIVCIQDVYALADFHMIRPGGGGVIVTSSIHPQDPSIMFFWYGCRRCFPHAVICVKAAPSDPNIVWAAIGEAVSPDFRIKDTNTVYLSIDGGTLAVCVTYSSA